MSGGIAYVYDEDGSFRSKCNAEMVQLTYVAGENYDELRQMVADHERQTGSKKAKSLLEDWDSALSKFVCVLPYDYMRMMQAINKAYSEGYSGDEALMIAFNANNKDVTRLSGN